MNNYKKMFDEINISDDCLRKVRNMERNNKKIKTWSKAMQYTDKIKSKNWCIKSVHASVSLKKLKIWIAGFPTSGEKNCVKQNRVKKAREK